MEPKQIRPRSSRAVAEEETLAFWRSERVFEQTLAREAPRGKFVFYEGPPGANGLPMLHHFEARAFKDVIPRYKTMQGFHVDRRAGWDTHGLPVELQAEKELGLTSKRDIEQYGIGDFNAYCRSLVVRYVHEWDMFTARMGYWVDNERAYYTMHNSYIESCWNIVSEAHKKGHLYRDYKIIPWCSRCGTGLSSHELGQPGVYQDVKELSVYAKFLVHHGQTIGDYVVGEDTYILAWTTTPWTLPGNVALAVGEEIEYVLYTKDGSTDVYIASVDYFVKSSNGAFVQKLKTIRGSELVGLRYEPLYPYLRDNAVGAEAEKMDNAYQVYRASFVTTSDGTGVVHTAVMYGADDFVLGTEVGLPKVHTVGSDGKFLDFVEPFAGRFVKEKNEKGEEVLAIDIIKDLAHRGLLYHKEKYEHSYPHCWRCNTPLLYYARQSWYFGMSLLRESLLSLNATINWEPEHVRDGRFGGWLSETRDWAVSRERYWGTPLPVWETEDGSELLVLSGMPELRERVVRSGNRYFGMRHGKTDRNMEGVYDCDPNNNAPLSEFGEKQVYDEAIRLKENGFVPDFIYVSPFSRTMRTAEIVSEVLEVSSDNVIIDKRISEWNVGTEYNLKPIADFYNILEGVPPSERFTFRYGDGESEEDVFIRARVFFDDIEKKHTNATILIITHAGVLRAGEFLASGLSLGDYRIFHAGYTKSANAEVRLIDYVPLPRSASGDVDLHRPWIDELVLTSNSGKLMQRVSEVMDVWFDSGAMPYAQDHYPFENQELVDGAGYPADFISEAVDQTRGWFYTLVAVSALLGRSAPFRNVICLGHILDAKGQKMSKSKGNTVDSWDIMNVYGADALRLWMFTITQPGDSKNFDEKTLLELSRKVFTLLDNVRAFYDMYVTDSVVPHARSTHVLDKYIISRLRELFVSGTRYLDSYQIFESSRLIREFIDDLSTWYIRRSRDRMKSADADAHDALCTLRYVFVEFAKYLAPFCPFYAEELYRNYVLPSQGMVSVHLEGWPVYEFGDQEESVLADMRRVRELVSLALQLRASEGIKVRQPLGRLVVPVGNLSSEYVSIIADELNVLSVVDGNEVSIDTELTPELLSLGNAREFIRRIQELRKQLQMVPHDLVSISVAGGSVSYIEEHNELILSTVGATNVTFVSELTIGESIEVNEDALFVLVEKNG